MKKTIFPLASVLLTALAACASPVRSDIAAGANLNDASNEEMVFVEYLESSGTQYIMTGFIPDGVHTVRVEVEVQKVPTGPEKEYGWIIGTQSPFEFAATYNDYLTQYQFYVTAGFSYEQDGVVISSSYSQGDKYRRAIAFKEGVPKVSQYEWALFARVNSSGAYQCGGNLRIYGCVIVSEEFSIDLVPVRIGSRGYMYDTIGGNLYGNAGTGSFLIGPDL